MTIWWCAGCGMEDTRAHNACPSCGSALQVAAVEWLPEGDREKETAFELDPEPLERAAIVDGLVGSAIPHRWEGNTDLIVKDDDADAVDTILDEVLGEDTREDGDERADQDDLDDNGIPDFEDGAENGYEILSDLFVATDRLQKSQSEDEIAEFLATTGSALVTGQPFGVDEETWADIQSAARNISASLEGDPKAQIDVELKGLRNQLQQLV